MTVEHNAGRKPAFLGIGAQKCASTWIYRILETHPEICVSDPKELDFFSSFFDRGYDWYEHHFAGPDAAAAGEVSPSYFYNPLAAERARTYNPDFKILVSLRDPVERIYSNHLHEVRKGHVSGDLSFERAMARNPMYIEQSRYGQHLKTWLDAFGAANVLVLLQEDIAEDPRAEAKRLCDFLGVEAVTDSEFFERRANENVVYKNPAVGAVYGGLGGAARAVGLGGAVRWAKKTGGVSAVWSLAKENLREKTPPMKPETVAAIRQELADDMAALAALLGATSLPWPSWRAVMERAA
jgi:hypothetical protein